MFTPIVVMKSKAIFKSNNAIECLTLRISLDFQMPVQTTLLCFQQGMVPYATNSCTKYADNEIDSMFIA